MRLNATSCRNVITKRTIYIETVLKYVSYDAAKAKLARRTGENQNSPYSGAHDGDVPG